MFAIYSTAAKPSSLQTRDEDNGHRLHDTARAVTAVLPVYTAWQEITTTTTPTITTSDNSGGANLISLPREGGGGSQFAQCTDGSTLSRRPWFLLNAARSPSHCIVGQGDVIQTLLATLQRPWCVLELCCIEDVEVLAAVLEFAAQAQRLDPGRLYDSAVYLLRWELDMRGEQPLPRRRRSPGPSQDVHELRTVCDAVFPPSAASFDGFWIRMICVCAVEMGVPFSAVVRLLSGMQSWVEVCPAKLRVDERRGIFSEIAHLSAIYARALGKLAELVA